METPDARDLLGQVGWIRELARGLVGPIEAEDVVQDALVIGMQRAPRGLAGEAGLRAWLAAVTRNLARATRRGEAHRRAREERAARPEALPGAGEMVAHAAHLRTVVTALMSLDEPYRSALLLRYYEGRSVAEIARASGATPGAVRTRLSRALAMLRARLTVEHGGDERAWMRALAPLAGGQALWKGAVIAVGAKNLMGAAGVLAAIAAGLVLWRVAARPERAESLAALAPAAELELSAPEEAAVVTAESAPATRETPRQDAPAPGGGVRVLAIEKEGGAPVAGADLWFGPQSLVYDVRMPTDQEDALRREGAHVVTDDQGAAMLRATEPSALVVRRGDMVGMASFTPAPGAELRVELEPQRSAAIQVVDAEGRPVAGVPVEVALRDPADTMGKLNPLWSGTTRGEEGLAVLHQLDATRLVRYATGEKDLAEGQWMVAHLPFPLAERVEVGFEPDDPPRVPVRLVLPPTGSLQIELEEADGSRLDAGVWVHANLFEERQGWNPQWCRRGGWYVRGGRLSIPHVGLGLELQLVADLRGFEPPTVEVAGPRVPGEEVRCVLRFDEERFAFVGRALDRLGTPLPERKLRLDVVLESAREAQESGRTDADGRFHIPRWYVEEGAALESVRVQTDPHDADEILFAEVALGGRTAGRGQLDLGELRLAPAPIAIAGRVVDEAGEPIYWVLIDLLYEAHLPEPHTGTQRRYDYGLRTNTRRDGRFVVPGPLEQSIYELQVKMDSFVTPPPLEVREGDLGLEIVLRRTVAVEGALLLPEGVPAGLLELELRREGAEARKDWRVGTHAPLPSGTFRIDGLAPGTYDLLVHLDLENGPVHVVEDVIVQAGGTSADPRLAAIDLRGKLFPFDFEVAGADASPVGETLVAFGPAGEVDGPRRLVLLEGGDGIFVSAWRSIDVELRAHGFRPGRLEHVSRGSRVLLERGIPLVLRLPEGIALPAPPLELRLNLVPRPIYRDPGPDRLAYTEDGSFRRWRRGWDRELGGRFDASRELRLFLPELGSYVDEWWTVEGTSHRASLRGSGSDLEIESDTGQELELGPDPQSWREKLAELAAEGDR